MQQVWPKTVTYPLHICSIIPRNYYSFNCFKTYFILWSTPCTYVGLTLFCRLFSRSYFGRSRLPIHPRKSKIRPFRTVGTAIYFRRRRIDGVRRGGGP